MRYWIIVLVLVTGCAHQFTPLRGQSDEQRAQDTETCKAESRGHVPYVCVWGGPAPVALATASFCLAGFGVWWATAKHQTDPARMWACMEARGYEGAKPAP